MTMDGQSDSVVVIAFDSELRGFGGGETIRVFIERPSLGRSEKGAGKPGA